MNTKLLDPPRGKGGPLICLVANLPAFPSESASIAFNNESHLPVLARWQCPACGGWHHWTTSRTDSNGAFKGGASEIPPRIAKLAMGWGMKESGRETPHSIASHPAPDLRP